MKLKSFETYERFKDYTFINEAELRVVVTVYNDRDNTLEVENGVTYKEVKEVMALIDSGKIEIEIL